MGGKTKIRMIEKCGGYLSSENQTTLTEAEKYYQISGTFTDGDICGFTLSGDGTITYNGAGGVFLFNGSSDLKSNKVSEVTYALFVNGINTGRKTPITFSSANSYRDIGITGLVTLERGDYLNVMAKSDTVGTTITVANLNLTFWGE